MVGSRLSVQADERFVAMPRLPQSALSRCLPLLEFVP
jgi:hypothetical protein